MSKKALVIVGPTASGKSALAIHLAKKFAGEIISADSRQVYKRLNVGTGKVTKKEMGGVKHHLLDIKEPKESFSANDFKNEAEKAISAIYRCDKLPIIAGGTGFYIDVLTGYVSLPNVLPNKALRKELEKKSPEALMTMLKEKDPERAKTIDKHNKVRLIRAVEVIEKLGKSPLPTSSVDREKFVFIGLLPENLDEMIRIRLKKRMPAIIREVRNLHKKGLTWKRMYELGLEYRYVSLYLRGKYEKKEMEEKLFVEIRRYAKRQMTWFKRNKDIKWFKPKERREIEKYVENKIKASCFCGR